MKYTQLNEFEAKQLLQVLQAAKTVITPVLMFHQKVPVEQVAYIRSLILLWAEKFEQACIDFPESEEALKLKVKTDPEFEKAKNQAFEAVSKMKNSVKKEAVDMLIQGLGGNSN